MPGPLYNHQEPITFYEAIELASSSLLSECLPASRLLADIQNYEHFHDHTIFMLVERYKNQMYVFL